jgi:ribosome biogenesis GTPase
VQKESDSLDLVEIQKVILVEQHRRTAIVSNAKSERFNARYSPNLVMGGEKKGLAVGDEFEMGLEEKSGDYYLSKLLPRRTKLSRPGPPDREHREQLLACNIDQVVVVTSAVQPIFNPGLVDRFAMVSAYSQLPITLVVNKMDLVSEKPVACSEFEEVVDKVLYVSAKDREGFDALQLELQDKFSVFTGQSGVGKSSLITKLIPGLDLDTGDVRERDGKGRHTTTVSGLFDLPNGGAVVDTPGIRGLGFWDLKPADLAKLFPAFQPWQGECKFSDCLHIAEPGCMIKKKLAENELSQRVWDSYIRILTSLEIPQ